MPSASPELQKEWRTDVRAIRHLQSAGFRLTTSWHWRRPPKPTFEMTDQHRRAIQYLVDEWDFGGLLP